MFEMKTRFTFMITMMFFLLSCSLMEDSNEAQAVNFNVQDSNGQTILFESHPEKMVVYDAAAVEILLAMGEENKIIANKEQIQVWFESNYTRERYEDTYGEDWWWKLNEMHDAMLEKLGVCCEDCAEEEKKPTGLMKFREMSKLNVWGELIQEAEYQGRKVELNNPTRGDVKKFKVKVKKMRKRKLNNNN